MPDEPLSVLLSRLLLAHTIELDNAFEERMAATLPERPFRVSVVMWSNFLRFVGDGIPVGELPRAAALPKSRVLSTLGGMERWRYVLVAPVEASRRPAGKRDGYGSARGLKAEWIVRPTDVGRRAQEVWPALFPEIEARWRERFGPDAIDELALSSSQVVDGLDAASTEYLPIVTGADGMRSEVSGRQEPSDPVPLLATLAQALLAYTLEFERESSLSLPLTETVVRALAGAEETDVRELPAAAAISAEAVAMALTSLSKSGHAVVAAKRARLTAAGLAAHEGSPEHHARVSRSLEERLGGRLLDRFLGAVRSLVDQREDGRARLALGLQPPPEGWRAERRYRAQTQAMLADPASGLPRHPLVLQRGGWPDGS